MKREGHFNHYVAVAHVGKLRRFYAPEQRLGELFGHAPQCSRCKRPMKVRTLLPGRKVDDVAYRCEDGGEEVVKAVPRVG